MSYSRNGTGSLCKLTDGWKEKENLQVTFDHQAYIFHPDEPVRETGLAEHQMTSTFLIHPLRF